MDRELSTRVTVRNEHRNNLKLARATMGRGQGRVKRTRRDESIGVIIHICIKTT
jgi:hypothetical protein